MAKIFDYFSRRQINQDTKKNSEHLDMENGLYIGNIGKSDAAAFISTVSVVEDLLSQILALQAEFMVVSDVHIANMEHIITMLKAEKVFDPEHQELSVSTDGHVWIVGIEEDEGDAET